MSWPYRCSRDGCRQRVTLRRPLERYVRVNKVCPACGCDSLRLDRWKRRDHRKSRCHCAGWWFPHRRGSLQCHHYSGSRDPNWDHLNAELGATPMTTRPGEPCPF